MVSYMLALYNGELYDAKSAETDKQTTSVVE